LHPVASAAMIEKAKTPLSNFFMNTPPAEFGRTVAQQARCRRRRMPLLTRPAWFSIT